MTDEEYVFRKEVADKKRTAWGANNKVRGRGKTVKMPSDFLTRKERKALNGEVNTYKLSSPVKWKEFKMWPDEIRREYLTNIDRRFGVGNTDVARMMGVSDASVYLERKRLCIPVPPVGKRKDDVWGFKEWWWATPDETDEKPTEAPESAPNVATIIPPEAVEHPREAKPCRLKPQSGKMVFVGGAAEVAAAMVEFFGNDRAKFTLFFEAADEQT